MCKRVLIPLDGSQLSESALASAAHCLASSAADLLLVGATRGRNGARLPLTSPEASQVPQETRQVSCERCCL